MSFLKRKPKATDEPKPKATDAPLYDPKAPVEKKAKAKKSAKSTSKVKTGWYSDAHSVLLRPMISEKATDLAAQNKYVFHVAPHANKIEIQKAIMSVYGVKPVSVRVISMKGKKARWGRIMGSRKNWKKAIVTVKPGESIQLYQGV